MKSEFEKNICLEHKWRQAQALEIMSWSHVTLSHVNKGTDTGKMWAGMLCIFTPWLYQDEEIGIWFKTRP